MPSYMYLRFCFFFFGFRRGGGSNLDPPSEMLRGTQKHVPHGMVLRALSLASSCAETKPTTPNCSTCYSPLPFESKHHLRPHWKDFHPASIIGVSGTSSSLPGRSSSYNFAHLMPDGKSSSKREKLSLSKPFTSPQTQILSSKKT